MQTLPGGGPTAVRWRIVALLAALSLVSYALRTNISVAAALMRTDLHLTDIQLGQVFTAFMIGYAIFQVPAGALGDRFGPRRVLTFSAAIWGLATLMTGALPGLIGGAAATLTVLLVIRFLLGVGEAATYPVAAAAVGVWMPPSERAFANALPVLFLGRPLLRLLLRFHGRFDVRWSPGRAEPSVRATMGA